MARSRGFGRIAGLALAALMIGAPPPPARAAELQGVWVMMPAVAEAPPYERARDLFRAEQITEAADWPHLIFEDETVRVFVDDRELAFAATPRETPWGFDLPVQQTEGDMLPVTFMRIQLYVDDIALLQTFYQDRELERFLIARWGRRL